MVSTKCCVAIIIGVLVAVGVTVGIYFATAKSGTKSENKDPHPSKPNPFKNLTVILKTKHSIMAYDLASGTYHKEATVNANPNNIISFDYYNNSTLYYATTEAGSPIQSAFPQKHPSLPAYTGEWTKTAMAVDQVTGKIYVADRIKGKIYIVDVLGEHHKELMTGLEEPFDILVSPYKTALYILTKSSIVVATMSGKTYEYGSVEHRDLRAMAFDIMNEILYYGAGSTIMMYDLKTEETYTFGYEVISLAVQQDKLLFIDKDRVFHYCISKSTGLINCQSLSGPEGSEPFESVKAYGSMSWIDDVRNPCDKKNGGCQHLCIPDSDREDYYVCVCDDGWRLKQDKKNCIKL